ncbi:MAG: cation:proton antiporter [Thermoplasmata archaeon]|nr:cation:proton antiporter [Thermoplasmata archaeon]
MAETLEDVLFAVILLLLLSRVLGVVARRLGAATLVGNVLAGLLLGPVLIAASASFGLRWGIKPSDPVRVFADFGILILMLYTGITTDFHSIRMVRRASILVGIGGVAATFLMIFGALALSGFDIPSSLFIAVLLSNTAIEVSVGILQRFPESRLKSAVIGASFVDDILAVILLGIVSSAVFVGGPEPESIAVLGAKVVGFLVVSLIAVSWALDRLLDRLLRKEESVMLTATLLTGLAFALLAGQMGVHPVIGAYVAGFVIGRWGSKPDPMLDHSIARGKLVRELEPPLTAFFAPFFFGYVGLLMVTAGDPDWYEVGALVAGLTTLALAGKVIGCGLGARFSGFGWKEGVVIGVAMGGRGGLELVLLRFGLDSEVITGTQFSAMVGVILMTVLVSPILFGRSARRLLGR